MADVLGMLVVKRGAAQRAAASSATCNVLWGPMGGVLGEHPNQESQCMVLNRESAWSCASVACATCMWTCMETACAICQRHMCLYCLPVALSTLRIAASHVLLLPASSSVNITYRRPQAYPQAQVASARLRCSTMCPSGPCQLVHAPDLPLKTHSCRAALCVFCTQRQHPHLDQHLCCSAHPSLHFVLLQVAGGLCWSRS